MIDNLRAEINANLETLIPDENRRPVNLHRAMRSSLLGGGKRARSLLCLLVSEAARGRGRSFALDAGCAIEMVHTASLILDDLPCMDDATCRRGRAATHLEYGQATAILASFGLLNRAFSVLCEKSDDARMANESIRLLSEAIGSDGMIAGQEIDLHERVVFRQVVNVEGLNLLKTGTLFVASGHIGALAAGLTPPAVDAVRTFAEHVGLAFQTADDIVDQTADSESAGKDTRQDSDKPTIVSLAGEKVARASCEEHLRRAHEALERSGLDSDRFVELVESVFDRAG